MKRENLENVDGLQRLEEQKREFERRSICDLATGLLNKKAFRHEVEKELLEYSRATTNAMVFLDIDNFKLMNDSYGHLLGDEVIRMLADKIKTYFGLTESKKSMFCAIASAVPRYQFAPSSV